MNKPIPDWKATQAAQVAEKSACDFTRQVDDTPAFAPNLTGSQALEAGYGRRYRIKRCDEDYNVTYLGNWLTHAEAQEWGKRLQAEQDAWNPKPGFGNNVSYSPQSIEPEALKGACARPGDLVIHHVVEPCEKVSMGDVVITRESYQIAMVVSVDDQGRVSAYRGTRELHLQAPLKPAILSSDAVHAAAAMKYLSLREAERGEYGEYAGMFSSAQDAIRQIAGFIRPQGPATYPSLPDRSIPDPRVDRRFPAISMYAAKTAGGYGAISLLSHDAKHGGLPVVEVKVEEIDAPQADSYWAWKQRQGIVFVRKTFDAVKTLFPSVAAEVERGYGQIVPVSVTEA